MNISYIFNEIPCYLTGIRHALKNGPIDITEISYDFPLYHSLDHHPMTHLKHNPFAYYNLLNLIFIFGILTSCSLLSCRNKKLIKSKKSQLIYVEDGTNTENDDLETKECEGEFVKAKIIQP